MSLLVSLLILAVIGYSAFTGSRRGIVLIGLELISFFMATALALAVYRPTGTLIKSLAGVTVSLGNIAAFVTLWAISEVICAVVIRFWLLPHLKRQIRLSPATRVGGSMLNELKAAAIITLVLSVFSNLPLSASAKQPVLSSLVVRGLLAASGGLPDRLAGGISHEIADSLSFFTVTADPESEQRIELGFKTANVTVDPKDEAAMLILLNHERTTRGLNPLTLDTKARAVARAYSTDMFARGYFSHLSLEGKSPFDRMKAAGLKYDSAGENLALAPTLQQAHDGLMKSPGHRANILSPRYRHAGIGIIDGGPHGLMVTQDFTD